LNPQNWSVKNASGVKCFAPVAVAPDILHDWQVRQKNYASLTVFDAAMRRFDASVMLFDAVARHFDAMPNQNGG